MRLEYGVIVNSTETYRFAMKESPFATGCNAQTIPKALRHMYLPPPGRMFVQGDLSQAEARIVAYLANCHDLIELFNDPKRSVHLENALAVFGHAVEKDTPEYTLAKAVIHASHYREGPIKFSVQTGLPVKEAKRLLANYHGKRPEIRQWHQRVYDTVRQTGKLTSPLGDERVFYEALGAFSMFGKMTDQQWKDAIAWTPQTTVPHITNLGILNLAKLDCGQWWHHQGHDSFMVSIEPGQYVKFCSQVPKAFNIPVVIGRYELMLPLELSGGYNFGDMMPYDGSALPYAKWLKWLDGKLVKQSRTAQILAGTYGVHLKDWRP